MFFNPMKVKCIYLVDIILIILPKALLIANLGGGLAPPRGPLAHPNHPQYWFFV